MRRSGFSAEYGGDFFHRHVGGEIRAVHIFRFRMKYDIYAFGGVRFQIPRISRQIFRRTELNRVDKHADDNAVIFGACSVNQTSVTVVQITHRRDETDGKPFFLPLSCDGLDFGRAGNDAGIIFCHDYRSPFVFSRADLCIFWVLPGQFCHLRNSF